MIYLGFLRSYLNGKTMRCGLSEPYRHRHRHRRFAAFCPSCPCPCFWLPPSTSRLRLLGRLEWLPAARRRLSSRPRPVSAPASSWLCADPARAWIGTVISRNLGAIRLASSEPHPFLPSLHPLPSPRTCSFCLSIDSDMAMVTAPTNSESITKAETNVNST